jgi:hypothetical protein
MDESRGLTPLTDSEPSLAGNGPDPVTSVPAMPVPAPSELGSFAYLVHHSRHLSVGWQWRSDARGGSCFLVGRETLTGGLKVVRRFPFTERGWAHAWRYLLATDPTLARQLWTTLTDRAAADRKRIAVAELDQQAVASVLAVTLLGGYAPDAELPTGEQYDLRFLADRLIVVRAGQPEALLDLQYGSIEDVEIGGPGLVRAFSLGQQVLMTELLGLIGEVIAVSSTKIQTVIRLNAPVGELFFLCTTELPDTLRIALSRPLAAIGQVRAARAPAIAPQTSDASAKVAELSRLASLLDAGLLTRAEFDQLKAQLLSGSGADPVG